MMRATPPSPPGRVTFTPESASISRATLSVAGGSVVAVADGCGANGPGAGAFAGSILATACGSPP
ncbi:MAG: hypothetical protein ACR652_15250 [Methylocystis sp.]|uniref:hypothetical protein n=1 Tax=Methylocystis sp. TaxID=1911079 RepID=UPI003DA44890